MRGGWPERSGGPGGGRAGRDGGGASCPTPTPSPSPQGGGERGGGALSAYLAGFLAAGEPAILVTVAAARGSTPREAGAAMLVTLGASVGTIGGGALEFHALDVARGMLARGDGWREVAMPLGPLLGQCCGGHVTLRLERAGTEHVASLASAETRETEARPPVLVFGCGHTGRALAAALAPLPFAVTVVDDRVDDAEPPPGAFLRLDDPADAVRAAPPGAAFVVMTHSHALDYRLVGAALGRGDAAYVGMIGSATKRARFASWYTQTGGAPAALARLTCPIGGAAVPDKRPAVIAALVAAELLHVFAERHAAVAAERRPVTSC